MKKSVCAVGAVTLAVLGTSLVGCGGSSNTATSSSSSASKSSSSSSSSESTSTSAAAADYSALLITPSDVSTPEDPFTADSAIPNPGGKPGIAQTFTNTAGTRTIGDTIFVFESATDAITALNGSLAAVGESVVNGQPASASVGSSGTLTQGQSPDGTKEVSVLLFNEGKAFVTMQFESAIGDPIPADAVAQLGQVQDDAIKANLPA